MPPRLARIALLVCLAAPIVSAAIPRPSEHFGHRMGADRKLVDWDSVVSYYKKVAAASDQVLLEELGPTTEGRPFLMLTIADRNTIRNLGQYRDIQARLADPRRTPPAEAERLIAQGKPVVLLTCSIHSTEVASTLSAIEFVYRLLAEDTPKHRAILQNTIFLLIPSLNPDGVDKVAAWYRRWVGTPYEGAPMTELYQKYVGHDNNRDWYIFSQQETRLAVEKAHNAWRPQIVYDVHQMGQTGARIFVPPWVDPVDPNIDPLIVQQVNAFGTAMAVDLTSAGKTGVVLHGIYDYFTPARHYQSYHGGMRLLSESASVKYATPVNVPFDSLQTEARGYNAQESSWNFLEPWPGGEWKLRDIVDNQLITFESCLYNAALRRSDLLRNFYRIQRRVIERNAQTTVIIPREQHDPNAMTRLLETLEFGMVEIERARRDFTIGRERISEGDYVIRLNQPYGAFAKTLLERQQYPDLREYPGGPPRRPYDVTAHTLPLLMGVDIRAVRSNEDSSARLERLATIEPPPGRVPNASVLRLSPALSHAWIAVNRLLRDGDEVYRDESTGDFYIPEASALRDKLTAWANELGLEFDVSSEDPSEHRRLRTPRIGLYRGHVPIMDEGWTRWVLEKFEFPYVSLYGDRIQEGDLRDDFDVVILPDAEAKTLHAGYVEGTAYSGGKAPPAYTGGIGESGAEALRDFVSAGGAVLAFNEASNYAIERLHLPVENALQGVSSRRFYGPGTLLNAEVDVNHPLCFGMRPKEAVWFESSPAFRTAAYGDGSPAFESVVRYPNNGLLASGWLLGEDYLVDRTAVADVRVGDGHVVLFGVRPQYRAQPNATFKMVFNGLFYWR